MPDRTSSPEPSTGNELRRKEFRERLDLLLKALTFLSTTAIALMAYNLSQQGERSRGQQFALDTVIKVVTLSASESEAAQASGYALLGSLSKDDFLLAFIPSYAEDPHFRSFIAGLSEELSRGRAPAGPTVEAKAGGSKWIYLGQYDPQNKRWDTRYLEPIDDRETPELLTGRELHVRRETGALNVRSGPATETYIAPIVGVMQPEQSVTILQVQAAGKNPHYWGRIK
jgi:hypothetical protein